MSSNMPGNTSVGRTDTPNDQRKAAESRPPRDKWDYVEILARPISAFMTAVTVAAIGWFGQMYLSGIEEEKTERAKNRESQETARIRDRELQETARMRTEQNMRLVTELMSKREQSETNLRKDMFKTILTEHLKEDEEGPSHGKMTEEELEKKLVRLELLALNFSDSLSLSPLFLELDDNIQNKKMYEPNRWRVDQFAYRHRLHSLARRVSSRQISAVTPGGVSFSFEVPVNDVIDGGKFMFPNDLFKGYPSDYSFEGYSGDFKELSKYLTNKDKKLDLRQHSTFELEGLSRVYRLTFSKAEKKRKRVTVKLEVDTIDYSKDSVEREFELSFFNFPLIDNTRLSQNQRVAVVLDKFDSAVISVTIVCFPGFYASERDKVLLNEAIDELRRIGLDETAEQ